MPPDTLQIQRALIAQGYPLPRWGADGAMGQETRAAMRAWGKDHGCPATMPEGELADRIVRAGASLLTLPHCPLVLDVRGWHPGIARKGINPWPQIDTVCLHQMACDDGRSDWQRWRDLAIHFAILRHGQAAYLNDCNALVYHGHGWNGRSVGLEIEGWYAGVEGEPETLWAPAGASPARRTSQVLSPLQAEAALQAIRLAMATVAVHGGKVRYVAAHRQSSKDRVSDPGSQIWQAVALPAMRELGLVTAPTLRGGRAIPEAWDPAQVGVGY